MGLNHIHMSASREVLEVRQGTEIVPGSGESPVYSRQVRAVVFLLIVL